MSSNLMDTVPGGESSQYESIKTVDKPTETQSGTFDDATTEGSAIDTSKAERGERTAENARYGQGISEGGMGGKTTESDGFAQKDGHGGVDATADEGQLKNTRREQKYGGMPNIGA